MPPKKKELAVSENAGFAFVEGDFTDLPGVVARLRGARDPVSQYLYGRCRPETRDMLVKFDGSAQSASPLARALADEFNKVIEDSAFYDAERFADVALSEKTRRLNGRRLPRAELVQLNVLLLEDSFPSELLRNLSGEPKVAIERVQTGVRIERRMLKVLKGLAEYDEVSLGELLEDIVLHAFEGISTFESARSRQRISALKEVYGMDYDAHAGPRFTEARTPSQ